jgi:hypothetical protein
MKSLGSLRSSVVGLQILARNLVGRNELVVTLFNDPDVLSRKPQLEQRDQVFRDELGRDGSANGKCSGGHLNP